MLVNSQKCIRTSDLDIIGKSNYHHTFFEMLGSWSILGAYSKTKAIELAFKLLTDKEYGFGMVKSKLIPTVFGGSEEAPEDKESIKAWKNLGVKKVSKLPVSENWWAPSGLQGPGPCGGCTEVLYDRGAEFGPEEEVPGLTDNKRYLEIWNAGVFMEYNRGKEGGKLKKLDLMSVDTGAGLERITTILNGFESNYEGDLFVPLINKVKSFNDLDFNKASVKQALWRISDHIKASSFMIVENVFPANKDQGFVLRRILRKIYSDLEFTINVNPEKSLNLVEDLINIYTSQNQFAEIDQFEKIKDVMQEELNSYRKVKTTTENFINRKYISKHELSINNPFDIYQSTGASKDLIKNVSKDLSIKVDFKNFDKNLKQHQELSKQGAGKKFRGGLAGTSDIEKKYHTATHLLHKALKEVVGEETRQMGSNINVDRLRFDFNADEKLTEEQLKEIAKIVNDKIKQKLPVQKVEMGKEEADKTGAFSFFTEKYGDKISIYYIGESINNAYSKEFCGGPHVKNTGTLGTFIISKQENLGKGVKRLKAVLI